MYRNDVYLNFQTVDMIHTMRIMIGMLVNITNRHVNMSYFMNAYAYYDNDECW